MRLFAKANLWALSLSVVTLGAAGLCGQQAVAPPAGRERLALGVDDLIAADVEPLGIERSPLESRVQLVGREVETLLADVSPANLEVWLFGGSSATGERRRLQSLLGLRIDDLSDLCGLNESQRNKLRLAGELDIRRFFESVNTLRTRIEALPVPRVKIEEPALELRILQLARDGDLTDEQSLFGKTIRQTLTAEQLARFERTESDLRDSRHTARLASVLNRLTEQLRLQDDQRRKLAQVLGTMTRPPGRFSRYDQDVILLQLAELRDPAFDAIFDAGQRQALNRHLESYRTVRAFLEQSKLLPRPNGVNGPSSDQPADALQRIIRLADNTQFPVVPMPQKRAWGTEQAAGPPDTFRAGDIGTAWASQSTDGQVEWLICHFGTRVRPRAVLVYETYNPGAVIKVSVFDEMDQEVTAWEGIDPTPRVEPLGVSIIPIRVPFKTAKIKIVINSPAVPGWNEIDAIGLRDDLGETHWARKVEASSTFGAAAPPPQVMVPAPEFDRLQRLEAEVVDLRKQLRRLKQLEADIEELKRLIRDQQR